jgi:hypothetical protein
VAIIRHKPSAARVGKYPDSLISCDPEGRELEGLASLAGHGVRPPAVAGPHCRGRLLLSVEEAWGKWAPRR